MHTFLQFTILSVSMSEWEKRFNIHRASRIIHIIPRKKNKTYITWNLILNGHSKAFRKKIVRHKQAKAGLFSLLQTSSSSNHIQPTCTFSIDLVMGLLRVYSSLTFIFSKRSNSSSNSLYGTSWCGVNNHLRIMSCLWPTSDLFYKYS